MNYEQNKQLWQDRVSRFRESGVTQENWCQLEGVKVSALRYWIRKCKEEEHPEVPQWICLTPSEAPAPTENREPLILWIGKYGIEISEGFHPPTLQKLIQLLSH